MLNTIAYRSPRFCLVAVLVAFAISDGYLFAAQVFDASQDFDSASNPSHINGGTFSYGYENTLGGTFALLPGTFTVGPVAGYNLPGLPGPDPSIGLNASNAVFVTSNITFQPHQLVLHPGVNGEYSVLRFTAPVAGTYSYNAVFNSADSHMATTDVHVLVGGIDVASAGINVSGGVGPIATLTSPSVLLSAGETIDFAVGFGPNDYFFDSTGLFATVTSVPEPSSIVLLVAGTTGLIAGALRTKRNREWTCTIHRHTGPSSSVGLCCVGMH